jgi:YfiH family protein
LSPSLIVPSWPAPSNVKALSTTRVGGASKGVWHGLNLGTHVGDDLAHVKANRAWLRQHLPAEPIWLSQVHGTDCVLAEAAATDRCADASISFQNEAVCVVMTADCLPVLFCNRAGTVVGAAHAGWRGLVAGVLEKTVASMNCPTQDILAWLGPAIGPQAFEVGGEVRESFLANDLAAGAAFVQHGDKWLADIYQLARQRLNAIGVTAIYGGDFCTVTDSKRFYSFRRDGVTGRMGSLIWRE